MKNSINKLEVIDEADLSVLEKLAEKDYSENTKKALASDFKHFLSWYFSAYQKPFKFAELTVRDIREYRDYYRGEKGHAVSTVNRRLVSIRILCDLAVDSGAIIQNPAQKVKQLAFQGLAPKHLDKTELRRLLKEVELRQNLRDLVIIQLMSGAGLRVSEVIGLKPEDIFISERKGYLSVKKGKGNKERKVPLNTELRELLTLFLRSRHAGEKLFVGQRGNLTPIAVNKIVQKYAEKAGIKCSPHSFRHSFAYHYLEKNPHDIVGLAQILGHSNINISAIYTQHTLENLQERVE